MESILSSIKSMLGIQEDYTHFDGDIIQHINSVFFVLSQLGVNPDMSYSIIDKTGKWSDYTTRVDLNAIKSYMYLKVRLLFDPPLSSTLIDVIKTQIAEYEFRIMITVDPKVIVVPVIDEEVLTW